MHMQKWLQLLARMAKLGMLAEDGGTCALKGWFASSIVMPQQSCSKPPSSRRWHGFMRICWSEKAKRLRKQRPYKLEGNSGIYGPARSFGSPVGELLLLLQRHQMCHSIAPSTQPHWHPKHFEQLIHISHRFCNDGIEVVDQYYVKN